MNSTIWQYWNDLKVVFDTKAYLTGSSLFLNYERPVITTLWACWPWLHIGLFAVIAYYCAKIIRAVPAYKKFGTTKGKWFPGEGTFVAAALLFGMYILIGTDAGGKFKEFSTMESTYKSQIPQTLPPQPAPYRPTGRLITEADLRPDPRDPRYFVAASRAAPAQKLREAAPPLLSTLDTFIIFTPAVPFFLVMAGLYYPYFLFGLAYDREQRKPHPPTEIVDRALNGGAIDQHALAGALSPSLAPVKADSLADKVERARLSTLAARLQADTAALDDRIAKETEIARLFVSHALKRKELADLEQQRRDRGAQPNG